ncbi:MAG: hypothetical protein JXJ04_13960, partial [Spirochaetales bacterium]|nr:hypothetical protein [Spirochaetales bacterium]
MNRIIIFILISFIGFTSMCSAQENPFFSKNSHDKNKQVSSPRFPGCVQKYLNEINNFQRELNNSLSTLSRKINREKDFGIFLLLSGIALIYGFIHALG